MSGAPASTSQRPWASSLDVGILAPSRWKLAMSEKLPYVIEFAGGLHGFSLQKNRHTPVVQQWFTATSSTSVPRSAIWMRAEMACSRGRDYHCSSGTRQALFPRTSSRTVMQSMAVSSSSTNSKYQHSSQSFKNQSTVAEHITLPYFGDDVQASKAQAPAAKPPATVTPLLSNPGHW